MSDQIEVFQAMREARRQQHREWKRLNMEALRKHGLFGRLTNHGECMVFTRPVKVDFYPSTGRWRAKGKTYSGGGAKFAAWYNEQMRALGLLAVPF